MADWRGGDLVAGYCREASAAGSRVCRRRRSPSSWTRYGFAPLVCLPPWRCPVAGGPVEAISLRDRACGSQFAMILAAIVMAVEADVSTSGFALRCARVVCGGRLDRSELGRGWRARLLRYSQLAAVALLLAAVAGAFTYLTLESEGCASTRRHGSLDTTRRLYDLIRGSNTNKIDPGVTRTLMPTTIAFRAIRSQLREELPAGGVSPTGRIRILHRRWPRRPSANPHPTRPVISRFDISSFFNGLAPGTYVVTVGAMGPKGQGRQHRDHSHPLIGAKLAGRFGADLTHRILDSSTAHPPSSVKRCKSYCHGSGRLDHRSCR